MNIEYVGRHVQLDERIRSRAAEKLAKVAKFLKEPIEVHVTLETEKATMDVPSTAAGTVLPSMSMSKKFIAHAPLGSG